MSRNQKAFSFFEGYRFAFLIFLNILFVFSATACTQKNRYSINLMPAPDVYAENIVDPFSRLDLQMQAPYYGILYATDRMPADKEDTFYLNKRGFLLWLGIAKTELGSGEYTWEEARRISLLKNRTDKYPLKVTEVEEIGILDRSFTVFTPSELIPDDPNSATRRFAQKINEKLATSNKKDVYIYVHGYKVVFNNPVLVSAELWHFLGYDGVFIAFAWPSTPETLAYASDLETAALSSHNLRILIEFLADETDAEQIHIIGYSAGTRVVISALAQMAFIHHDKDKAAIQRQQRIGRVILTGSDLDRQLFGAYLVEGLLNVPKSLTIYVSGKDRALGMSRWFFRRDRLGQMWTEHLNPRLTQYLKNTPELCVIDVTAVEGSAKGNGHAYFRDSPWVSSDVLMSLMYDLDPSERGLVRSPNRQIWTFPEDYIHQLRANLLKRRP
jgi:esterase/lipase superfamily enzyme